MKTITLKIPDDFTKEQEDFIKQSAVNQIEAEVRKELKVPQADIDACEAKITSLKDANITKESVE